MSQLLSTSSAIAPGSAVIEITGNTGGAVPPDGVGNINIVGAVDSFVTVTGDPGTNTLEISLLNQLVAVVQTTDATPLIVTALDFPLTVGRAVNISYEIVAAVSDYSQMYAGTLGQSASRDTGGVSTLQPGFFNNFIEGIAGLPSTTCVLVGNTVRFQVTGVAATTINWKIVLQFLSI